MHKINLSVAVVECETKLVILYIYVNIFTLIHILILQ
jgi:hypothetical protein